MKISKKTLAAAQKAADNQGVSLDTWAEKVLASAAAAERSPDVLKQLREISDKIDELSNRQGVVERANEQLAAAIQEAGKSYAQVRRTTGQLFGDFATRTGSAIDEVRGRTRDLIAQVNKLTSDGAERSAETSETAPAKPQPTKRKKTTRTHAAAARKSGSRPKPPAGRTASRSSRRT